MCAMHFYFVRFDFSGFHSTYVSAFVLHNLLKIVTENALKLDEIQLVQPFVVLFWLEL